MVFQAKSIKQQNDKTINHGPVSIFYSLTPSAQRLFLTLIGYCKRYGVAYPTQDILSNDISACSRTINRATKLLESSGLLYVQRRFRESSVIVIPQLILQNEQWRGFLRGICAWIPPIVLNLSLLSSSGSENVRLLRSGSGKDLSINVSLNSESLYGSKKSEEKIVTPDAKIEKVKGICMALMKRNSYMTNELALGFMAFDLDVLERACDAMKKRKDIQYPAAYFNTLCREITAQDGRRPDFASVHRWREDGLVLIAKEDEIPVVERPVIQKTPDTQKREQQATSYTEQVRKRMEEERLAAEARESKYGPLKEELAKMDKVLAEQKVKCEGSPVLMATYNYLLRCREELIKRLTPDVTPNTNQISTEKKEEVSPLVQVGSWKQIDPIGSLKPVLSARPVTQSGYEDWHPTEADELYDPDIYEEQ